MTHTFNKPLRSAAGRFFKARHAETATEPTCTARGGCPDLTDDAWVWGGQPEEIFHTIKYGVRWSTQAGLPAPQTRSLTMPKFQDVLAPSEIISVAAFTSSLFQGTPDTGPGEVLFSAHCASCHGSLGAGGVIAGVPAIFKRQQLLRHSPSTLEGLISSGLHFETSSRGGSRVMPPWGKEAIAAGSLNPVHATLDRLFGYREEDIACLVAYVRSMRTETDVRSAFDRGNS